MGYRSLKQYREEKKKKDELKLDLKIGSYIFGGALILLGGLDLTDRTFDTSIAENIGDFADESAASITSYFTGVVTQDDAVQDAEQEPNTVTPTPYSDNLPSEAPKRYLAP